MNQLKHSEAPWSVVDGFVIAKDGSYVADPHLKGGPEDHAERDANGILIAAAPALLAALEAMVACADGEDMDADPIDAARAALRLARGE